MNLFLVFSLAIISAAVGFSSGAEICRRRMRSAFARTLRDTVDREIARGKKVEEALQLLQRKQAAAEANLRTQTEALARARIEMNNLRERLEQRDPEADAAPGQSRMVH